MNPQKIRRAHSNSNLNIIVNHQAWNQIDVALAGEIPDIQNTYIDRQIWAKRLSTSEEELRAIDSGQTVFHRLIAINI